MKAELERKRKQKAEEFGGRKFVKRSEIEAVRKAQRAELQAPKEEPAPVRFSTRVRDDHTLRLTTGFSVLCMHAPVRGLLEPPRGLGFGKRI